ncbi:hypothetical protein PENSPDRAFT_106780 [Peniophora sp. CONT]|nr:hypothetical protein PENSPDRAFT_106780 [Peniophora sp. CONT]
MGTESVEHLEPADLMYRTTQYWERLDEFFVSQFSVHADAHLAQGLSQCQRGCAHSRRTGEGPRYPRCYGCGWPDSLSFSEYQGSIA